MNRISASVGWFSQLFTRLGQCIWGDISWRPPGWMRGLKAGAQQRPVLAAVCVLSLIALMVVGGQAWYWYAHLPKPPMVGWIVNMGDLPGPSGDFQPQDLTLSFDKSVVRLDSIGKDVTRDVRLSPSMGGKWTWVDGTRLVFEPTAVWPAGTKFKVTLSRELFSWHARFETLTKEFHTAPFTAKIGEMTFYVNPKDPSIKQITATLVFSHPVDRASLEKNLELAMESGEQVFPGGASPTGRCTITYDWRDRVAYIRSANITVPKESGHAILTLPEEVVTTAGGAHLEPIHEQVLVPSTPDLFRVDYAGCLIATNRGGEPEQALVLKTTVGVKSDLVNKALHAWILPKRTLKNDSGTYDNNAGWKSAAEVTPAILAQATPFKVEMAPSQEEYATLHSFKLRVPENAWIYLEVDKGLEAMGGFKLAEKFSSVQLVPPYPRQVQIMHDGALLALSGERKLSIQSRGVEQLEFRLERVTPSSINHLVSQSEGNFQSPVFTNYNFDETNICEQIIRRQSIADTDTSKNDYSALDFSEFVTDSDENRGKLGLFILRVLGRQAGNDGGFYKTDGGVMPDPKTSTDSSNTSYRNGEEQDPAEGDGVLADRRLILVTDLGLIVKDNADGTHDVFVQSIKTGEPVGGAKVEVLGKNGIAVVSGETDDAGRATLPSLEDFKREKKPVAYVVHRDQDVSFLPFGREDRVLNFSRFDTAGVTGLAPHDLTAFVFTDRGIYRPGDVAKLGLIIKQRDWQGKLDGVPLRLDIVDPRGTVVQSKLMKLNAGGFLETTFATRETSATGKYEVDCYLVKGKDDETLLGSQTLRVAEFLPDRMKIKATLSANSPEGWISATGLTGHVSLQNLYGAPSVGHRITGKVTLSPSQFSFARYPDYSFTDPYLHNGMRHMVHEQDLPEQVSSETGEATFDLSMANMDPSAYRLSFLTEGFEKEGGRSVTAGAEVLVSPRAWLVGVKPDGDFSYVHRNAKRCAELLAVDSQVKPVAVEHLKMKLTEIRYVSVLAQNRNGNYAYESVRKEIPVNEEEMAIPEKGLAWPLRTEEPGNFEARLYDDHDDLVADISYSVAGDGNISRSLEKNAELTAKLSKPEYLPGEEVEVEITAPYTGAGLLTIERDKVYAHAWFQAKTTSSIQRIKLPKDFEGNGYLNIAFVRALDSKEIYMSPLSYAVLPFKVNQEARHTKISIDVPKVALPEEPMQISVTASRPTQAVVYAVDEGILQVSRYVLPDPLGFFFRKQALEVGTRQTVNLILPEYSIAREVAAAGGDGDDDALAHHLNPFKRKHDAPVAYWSGMVDIGPEAKIFTYHVPDYFAGTLRVMVVANTADAVGSAEKTLQVRGPFVISPNVPTFVAPGDTFDVSTAIANNIDASGPDAQVKVDLQVSEGLEIVQKPTGTLTIAEGRDLSTHWLLRAKDKLGNADLTIFAESGGKKVSLASHLSIRPPVPYLTTLTTGYFKGSEKKVPVARKLYPEYRHATALISSTPQGLTRGLGAYLEHYEYGCTEQLVSKAFPSLVTDETMQQGLSRAQVAGKIAEIIGVAATRQSDDGAFGLWIAQPDLHFDLPSAWVMLFLTEAKEQGYDIPSDLMTRGLGHLQQDANGTAKNFNDARTQAFEIYLLARNGTVVTNAVEHNRKWFEQDGVDRKANDEWHEDVAAVYDASTYALLKDQDQADALLKGFHLRPDKLEDYVHWYDFYDALGRNSQYIYLVSRHFPDQAKKFTGDDLMSLADPIMGGEYTTLSSAWAIMALDSYARSMKQNFEAGNVEIDQLTGNVLKKLELTGGFYPEGSFDREADALVFKRGSVGHDVPGLFYQMTQSGFEQAAVTTAVSEGIEVSREYRNKNNEPVTTAALGEELTVVLRVRSTGEWISNVAVEDLLPGGFEIVEESARTGANTYGWGSINYIDVREDRLLAFGSVGAGVTEIKYRIKATNMGTYAIPPPQAEAMYHLKIRARGVSGTLTVGSS